jgi:hypothetical protein
LPAPSSTTSIKMPQNTPNAVRNVLSLCLLTVAYISVHYLYQT